MLVLLACPDSDLPYARSERSDWIAADRLQIVEVPSPVTLVAFTRSLRAVRADLMVIIGHGGPVGIVLDNGDVLDYGTLSPLLRNRVPYLFLNTCESDQIATEISQGTGVTVCCTVGKVDDARAYVVGSALASYLNDGASFEDACACIAPENSTRGWKVVAPKDAQEGSTFCLPQISQLWALAG